MLNCAKRLARVRFVASLFLFLIPAACGYTVVQEKGIFRGEVISLDVPVFKNQSFEPQVSQFFTEAFTRELVTSGLFDVNKPDAPNAAIAQRFRTGCDGRGVGDPERSMQER